MKLNNAPSTALSADMLVPASHPALAGHFPGHPVVPAALLLDILSGYLESMSDRPVIAAKQWRFSRLLPPQTPFNTTCQQGPGNEIRVRCSTQEHEICRGRFVLQEQLSTTNLPTTPWNPSPASLKQRNCATAYRRLPHAGRMQLIPGLARINDTMAASTLTPGSDNPFYREGKISPWIGLELAAQLLACHTLLREDGAQDAPALKDAYIVAVKRFALLDDAAFQAQQPLRVLIDVVAMQPKALNCDFQIQNDWGELLNEGNFSVSAASDNK